MPLAGHNRGRECQAAAGVGIERQIAMDGRHLAC